MKNFFWAILVCAATGAAAQNNSEVWRLGAQLGFHSGNPYLKSGDAEASALFGSNGLAGGALDLLVRYEKGRHLMFTSGLGLQSFSYQFSLARNYTLGRSEERYAHVSTEFGMLEIPVMLHYRFNPNCRNVRWVLGAGWTTGLLGTNTLSATATANGEMGYSGDYLNAQTTIKGGGISMLRLSVAREKELRQNGLVSVGFVLNFGTRELSETTVNYQALGKTYQHVFGQNGTFAGFRLAYYFRPLPAHKKPGKKP